MDEREIYLAGTEEGTVIVQCEREECRVPGPCSSGLCWWTSEDLYHPTPEECAEVIALHQVEHMNRDGRPHMDRPRPPTA